MIKTSVIKDIKIMVEEVNISKHTITYLPEQYYFSIDWHFNDVGAISLVVTWDIYDLKYKITGATGSRGYTFDEAKVFGNSMIKIACLAELIMPKLKAGML